MANPTIMCADFVAAIWGAMPDDASDADLGAALCMLMAHFFETLSQARGEVIAEQHREAFIETLQEINLSTSSNAPQQETQIADASEFLRRKTQHTR
jgi:hypothetical protein